MERSKLSDISAVNVGIEICNNPELKKEILCLPGSDYDVSKGNYHYDNKKQWNAIVERKTAEILKNLGIAKQLQENIMGVVLLAGMRMLNWAEYHEGTMGFSREYSFHFLNNSLFTQQGIIDNKKAAEELMKDESLNAKQKYKLACLYCFTDHILDLYSQMAKEEFYDSDRPQSVRQPELVKFWSYYLMGEIRKLRGEKSLEQYRLEKALESGSKAAVEYCLEGTNSDDALIEAAVEAVKCRVAAGPYTERDWIVFRNHRYNDSEEESWVPSDYYVDILSFLLSKMREDQLIEFLKQDIEGAKYKRENFTHQKRSRVLEYFLNWPYQDQFMETAKLMWEFLPKKDYAALLLRICDRIESKRAEYLTYGQGKSYNYRGLLREFWRQSPERYKRYVFSNQQVNCVPESVTLTKAGVQLLINLITLKSFTNEDRENIEIILASATSHEKGNFLSSEEWLKVCTYQMRQETWELLDRFVRNCFLSTEEEDKFRRELSFTRGAQYVCVDFIKKGKWNAADSFINWSHLSEAEANELKKEMIYSDDGIGACLALMSRDRNVEAIDHFIRWCFPSEDEVNAFKKALVFNIRVTSEFACLVKENEIELVKEFVNYFLSSEEEIRELKKQLAYGSGCSVCEKLISNSEGAEFPFNAVRTTFTGCKWEEVEIFLTWCFSSEEEINDFKKNVLFRESGEDIHFNLIRSNRWEEAETFFAWLGVSDREIKDLKKDTLLHYIPASEMFRDLMYSEEGDKRFLEYGSKQEAIQLLLRWCLKDKKTVEEFKVKFKLSFYGDMTEERQAMFENFDLAIKQRLKDLDEETKEIECKSETFPLEKNFPA